MQDAGIFLKLFHIKQAWNFGSEGMDASISPYNDIAENSTRGDIVY